MSNVRQRVILKFKDEAFVTKLTELLSKTGKVKISGLGIFEIREVKERKGYGIGTDGSKPIIIPAHKKIAFRPTKKIRNLIQSYGD
jgi:nucleoid DNA-binding protein